MQFNRELIKLLSMLTIILTLSYTLIRMGADIKLKDVQLKNVGFVIGELSIQKKDCKFVDKMINEYKEEKLNDKKL